MGGGVSGLGQTLFGIWLEMLGPAWMATDDNEGSEVHSKELLLRAAKYVYFCPACENHGLAEGQYVICCGLQIEPYYITREIRLSTGATHGHQLGEVGEAMRKAAHSGGTVSGGAITERELTAPRRRFP